MKKLPISRCPACNAILRIRELSCPGCGTKIQTNVQTCPYCALSQDLRHFLHVFIATRGNIKEVERQLGISYPTVRKRLDELIKAMGIGSSERTVPRGEDIAGGDPSRIEVFEKLRRGEITVEDAVNLLGEGGT